MNNFERGSSQEERELDLGSPEELIENGEAQGSEILKQILAEGEMAAFRFFQGLDRITGNKFDNKTLRQLVLGLGFEGPVTDLEAYREAKNSSAMAQRLQEALELAFGTLSVGARKTIAGIAEATANFANGLGGVSEKTSHRFGDAKRLYGLE